MCWMRNHEASGRSHGHCSVSFQNPPAGTSGGLCRNVAKAIYYDGLHPLNLAGYAPYAAAYGVDGDQFVAAMSDPAFERAAKKEFAYTAGVGVNGFPTVLVQNAQRSYVVARGYLPYPALRARVKQALDLLAQE